MKLKKYVIRTIFLLPILLGVIYFWYRVPWGFHKEFEGIYYKPGDPSFSEKVTILFDGYLQRGIWQDDKFEGTLRIGDQDMLGKLEIPDDEAAYLMYRENYYTFDSYGTMYTKDIKKGFTILVYKQDETNQNHSGWTVEDGYVISAPADNRSEALKLSRDLASEWLEGSKE